MQGRDYVNHGCLIIVCLMDSTALSNPGKTLD
jgi:hypothetical protein